jgi:hypothetical protein
MRVRPAGPGKPTFAYPTFEQRLRAAELLAKKLVPDMTSTEITGPEGGPIELSDASAVVAAREIAIALETVRRRNEAKRAGIGQADEPRPAIDVTPAIVGSHGSVPQAGAMPHAEPEPEGPQPDTVNGYRLEREHQYAGAWWRVIDPMTGLVCTRGSAYKLAAAAARSLAGRC